MTGRFHGQSASKHQKSLLKLFITLMNNIRIDYLLNRIDRLKSLYKKIFGLEDLITSVKAKLTAEAA